MKTDQKKTEIKNKFYTLGISANILSSIKKLKFSNPTPIQEKAIPAANAGDDVIALAQTGSGKTLAFGIPMLQRLYKNNRATGLILVPTRELAQQVEESLQPISRPLNIRSTVIIGGASMNMQLAQLKKNPQVIIATPGRLMDHIQRRTVDLSHVEVFVLDEADRMLDMGFVPDIKKIIKEIPEQKQTMLFSATMPKEIEAIAQKLMTDPTRLEIDHSGVTPAEISQEMFFISNQDKSRLLAHHLQERRGPVLVFTRTKRMATKLSARINRMGFSSAEIHSNRSQGQRRNALEGFKRGRYQVLIATDIAARGIDVSGIELVVNYDMPANSEDYVHRIGRTGRAGKSGHAVSFATKEQRGALRDLERFMKTKLTVSIPPALPNEQILIENALKKEKSFEFYKKDKPTKRKPSFDRPVKPKKSLSEKMEALESGQSQDKKKKSKKKTTKPAGMKPKGSDSDKPFWSNFKKKKSAKKKTSGKKKSASKKHSE